MKGRRTHTDHMSCTRLVSDNAAVGCVIVTLGKKLYVIQCKLIVWSFNSMHKKSAGTSKALFQQSQIPVIFLWTEGPQSGVFRQSWLKNKQQSECRTSKYNWPVTKAFQQTGQLLQAFENKCVPEWMQQTHTFYPDKWKTWAKVS